MIWQAARYQPKLYVVQGIGPSLALGSNLIAGNHHDLAILKGNDKKGRLRLSWISFPSAHECATAASCNEKNQIQCLYRGGPLCLRRVLQSSSQSSSPFTVTCLVSRCLLRGSGWLWLLSEANFSSLLQATCETAIVRKKKGKVAEPQIPPSWSVATNKEHALTFSFSL